MTTSDTTPDLTGPEAGSGGRSGDTPDTSAKGVLAGLDPHLKRLAVVVVLGSIMSILDTTIVNVAIPTLAKDFRAPLSTVQWVSTGYLLALAMTIPLTGWAVERFGAKRMWIASLGRSSCWAPPCPGRRGPSRASSSSGSCRASAAA